jgi:UDPglucose 6-dehydrogenase
MTRQAFSTELANAVAEADLIFIAVGTPTRRGDGYADLKYVYAAAAEIEEHLQGYTVIVEKSTVPVGTAREVRRIVKKTNPNAEFDVASNPEFLREYQSGTSIDCTSFSPLWYSNQWVSRIISKL